MTNKFRPWTPAEDTIIIANYGGMTILQLVALLPGRTESSTKKRAQRLKRHGLNQWEQRRAERRERSKAEAQERKAAKKKLLVRERNGWPVPNADWSVLNGRTFGLPAVGGVAVLRGRPAYSGQSLVGCSAALCLE